MGSYLSFPTLGPALSAGTALKTHIKTLMVLTGYISSCLGAPEDLAFALCIFIHPVSLMSLNFLFISAPLGLVGGKQSNRAHPLPSAFKLD